MKIAILIITYTRPTFLPDIFDKLSSFCLPVFLYQNRSPQYPAAPSYISVSSLIQEFLKRNTSASFFQPSQHLSVGESIRFALTHVAHLGYDYTLVIEDDIYLKLPSDNISPFLYQLTSSPNSASLSFHSPLEDRQHNRYLLSPLFHSWGYILSNSHWLQFLEHQNNLNYLFYSKLIDSSLPLSLRGYYSLAYLSQTGIINTWDYQWSAFCIYYQYSHILLNKSYSAHLGDDSYSTHKSTKISKINPNLIRISPSLSLDNTYRLDGLLTLLRHHHRLTPLRSILLIILSLLPFSLASTLVSLHRYFKR